MMNILWIVRTELRRLIRSRIGLAAVVVGTIIPLLYSSLYLYAFWDPYDNLNQFPVAIVNQDQGADKDGEHVGYGQDLVEELVEEGTFKFVVTSAEEAKAGLVGDEYYLMMTIPPNFSSDVLSVDGDTPRKAQLQFVSNEGKNYIASTISQRLETTVREEVGNKFSEEYVKQIFTKIDDAGDGLTEAADGAGKLADGAGKLTNGAGELQNGLTQLADGTRQLQSGSTQLADGASTLASGSQQLASGAKQLSGGADSAKNGAAELQKGADLLAAGSEQVATGLTQSTAAVKQVRDGLNHSLTNTDRLIGGLGQMQGTLGALGANGHPAAPSTQDPAAMSALEMLGLIEQKYNLAADPLFQGALQKIGGVSGALSSTTQQVQGSKTGLQQAVGALDQVANGQDKLIAGAQQVANGNQELATEAGRLQSGLNELSQGTNTLAVKTSELAAGSQKVADGTKQVADNTGKLVDGTGKLIDGTGKLISGGTEIADGNRKLADELGKAAGESGVKNADQTATVMAAPIEVQDDTVYPVATYGMGFAAYFIPLSLWVGALMLYFILSLREYRWFLTPVSSTSLVLGKFMTLAVIGVAQAVISSVVLTEVLGLNVTNLAEFYLFNILVSMTSIAIIGLLIARFGSGAGRFLAILLLILQLTSSSGTFPIELVPGFFQLIHPFLPMTYGVEGLRALIAMGDQTTVLQAVSILGSILLAVLVVNILTTRRTLRVSDLHAKDELAG